jgi:cytochrome b subunit of formate dehydrogenase
LKKVINYIKAKNKIKFGLILTLLTLIVVVFALRVPTKLFSQDNSECLACHEDKSLTMTKGKKTVSIFVDHKKLGKSIHAGLKCVECHTDYKPDEFPHNDKAKRPSCGNSSCHNQVKTLYNECLHGKSKAKGDPLAPSCVSCHGSHEIYPRTDKRSTAYPLNVPSLCGKCHREGSPVQLQRNIPQTHILENYSESIHGIGLIKKGLTVAATCASCHSPHRILPHTDPRSTINRNNIAATCIKCHASIEEVHKKVIKGELWEKEAKTLPACNDCHQPHKIRQVFYEQNLSDESCKKCHENHSVGKASDGRNMFVNHNDLSTSVHSKLACTQCHIAVVPSQSRPCTNLQFNKVDCNGCHDQVGNDYKASVHGKLFARGDTLAPRCADCHGTHKILTKTNPLSKTFAMNIPGLCSKCHEDGKKAAAHINSKEKGITKNYSESIHGKGLVKSGLTVTATCADCHTAHKELPKKDPESSVNRKNIAQTCGKCHFGIQEKFNKSIHSPSVTQTDKKLPECDDCHSAHTIKRVDQDDFRHEILSTCGKCHMDISKTYFETYHGKVSWLGSNKAAKCNDCHGSHEILPPDNPDSKLSRGNIVQTCKQCHKNATKGFTKYLTHATHHDSKKYPVLFFVFWGMTLLLLGTFTISFLHTLLWLPRSIQMRKEMKKHHAAHPVSGNKKLFQRFTAFERLLHFTMIACFLSLASTGMIVKFSYTPLANILAGMMGGIENAGIIHRLAATGLFGVFFAHIWDLFRKKKNEFKSWKDMLLGPDSMVPNKKDLEDVKASFKWFLGKGPRPNYGRWTYWEKFDYFAVFWGIFVIGGTGLALWFPEFLTFFVPGWFINVATIIHSDEALLAAGFIFTVHFFNTHFRPEKFPMDTVIFSGQVTVEELQIERPDEYNRLIENGKLENYLVRPFSDRMLRMLKIFGWFALVSGLIMVFWIVYAMLSI